MYLRHELFEGWPHLPKSGEAIAVALARDVDAVASSVSLWSDCVAEGAES